MTTLLAEQAVSPRRKKGEGAETLSVKLHLDVVESARIVAAFRNDTITDLLSDTLRPILARMEREEMAKRTKRNKPE